MAKGLLGAAEIAAANGTAVPYQLASNAGKYGWVSLNVCNKIADATPSIQVAITEQAGAPLDAEWLDYNAAVPLNGVGLREGLLVGPGQKLYVKSDKASVAVTVIGIEVTLLAGQKAGLLGAVDLTTANQGASPYTIQAGKTGSVLLNICNRNADQSATVLVGITSSASPAAGEWIEYGAAILPKGVLIRTALMLDAGQKLYIQSNRTLVNAVLLGIEE